MTPNTMTKITQADIDEMPLDTKLELVEAIWDSIADSQETIPVPQWHKPILDKALEDYKNNPNDGTSWEEVRQRILEAK